MQTYQQTYQSSFDTVIKKQSPLSRFFAWCGGQEHNRFAWLAIILFFHGCVLTPVTLLFVFAAGNDLIFFCMTTAAMAMSLVPNLAAMPTKVTIPVFFFSVLIDVAVIVLSVNQYIQGL
jgi:hypothetical protein